MRSGRASGPVLTGNLVKFTGIRTPGPAHRAAAATLSQPKIGPEGSAEAAPGPISVWEY
jgi:hypothetical protein